MRVEVYRNLRNGKYSVRSLEGHDKGRVIAHLDDVLIYNPRFVVQPAGNRKVRKTGQKNVHAFVRGHLVFNDTIQPTQQVMYNPYKFTQFVDASGKAVYNGKVARLDSSGVRYN